MDTQHSTQEIWHVETGGEVYEASLDEITARINDGSLVRIDRVRRGELRWIEAGKVPALVTFFNAKDAGAISTSSASGIDTADISTAAYPGSANFTNETAAADGCSVHSDAPVAYSCGTCLSQFCKACPARYGSNVRICPFCGAMCVPAGSNDPPELAAPERVSVSNGKFGFVDLAAAIAFPFKYKTSLVLGAMMFAVFQIAGGGGPFGGIFMIVAGLSAMMMANTLTFGILAHTVENFSQGRLEKNFMPPFDDFNIWDDVVHPFFLSIGVYISSFGPLVAVAVVGLLMIGGGAGSIGEDAAANVDPGYAAAPRTLAQGQALQQLASKTAEAHKERIDAMQGGPEALTGQALQAAEDKRFEDLDKMIKDSRRQQMGSAVGKAPETKAVEQQVLLPTILGYGPIFLIAAGIAMIWGLFYFPAACAVAGYTRSFAATLNPSVGLDTIKRLGGSYFLLLVMCLFLLVASLALNGILSYVFSAFDMPSVGNLPAKAIGSLTGFYLWIVFSCIVGSALYRAADRLSLYR